MRDDDLPSSSDRLRPTKPAGERKEEAGDPFADFREEHRGALTPHQDLPPETPIPSETRGPEGPSEAPTVSETRTASAAKPPSQTPGSGTRRVAFVLHAHLPWVLGQGRWPHGEEWLTEAALHCYLPLLDLLGRLGEQGHRRLLTVSLTPVLVSQLADPRFPPAFERDLAAKLAGAEALAERHPLGDWWSDELERLGEVWKSLDGDLPVAFRRLEEAGVVEISTAAATHPYLPLAHREEHVRLQLAAARENHRRWFGREPRGLWMPECAYRPGGPWEHPATGASSRFRSGNERFLEEAGFRWTVTDAHLLLGGEPFLGYGFPWVDDPNADLPPLPEDEEEPLAQRLQPTFVEDSGVVAFFREPHTARQVWARQTGYPGDPSYLDFHKRHEADGLRLWRVTDAEADLAEKLPYWPPDAEEAVRRQADHFVSMVAALPGLAGGVALCPYDAELFGHWWFEGPRWLEAVLERISDHPGLETTTPSRELGRVPDDRRARLLEGSWGEGGDHRVWVSDDTVWMWNDLRDAEEAVDALLRSGASPARGRAAVRQLLLLAASDWPFLVTMGAAREYAIRRFQLHRDRLRTLIDAADSDPLPAWADEDLSEMRIEPAWWSRAGGGPEGDP